MSTGTVVVIGVALVGVGGVIWYVTSHKKAAAVVAQPAKGASKSDGFSLGQVISTAGSAVALGGSIASLFGY